MGACSFFCFSRCVGEFQGACLLLYRVSPTKDLLDGILELTLLAYLKDLWSKSPTLDIYGHMIVLFYCIACTLDVVLAK